jgi:hypothetical protein
MCPKIRCDGESEKFYKIFWELNGPLASLGTRINKTTALFSSQFQPLNFTMQKKKISIISKCRYMHEVLNVDKIKN